MTYADLKFKLQNYPNVEYNMLQHSVFHDMLSKASEEQLDYMEDFFDEEVLIITNFSRSGSAKTYTSVACAYANYLNKEKEIVLIMSAVEENSVADRIVDFYEKSIDYFCTLGDILVEFNLI